MKKSRLLLAVFVLFLATFWTQPGSVSAQSETKNSEPIASTTLVSTESFSTTVIEPEKSSDNIEISSEQDKVRELMENYGQVDEYYLSDSYWEKVQENIAKYGKAKRILTLEFHGDNYSMFSGNYEMNPAFFEKMMRYLLDNDYHFVTGPEMVGFLEGWVELPSRSIILTSDSGYQSVKSFERIIALYQNLEKEYGVRPHMLSFIWTWAMTEQETKACKDDLCWNTFRTARDSGYFSFGTHTQSHGHFDQMTDKEMEMDLKMSFDKIHDNLGLSVYGISWPFEMCSPFEKKLKAEGYRFGLGGWVRETNRLFAYANDNMALCLPRLFPPNTDGYSGRPAGKTLEQMLNEAADVNVYKPLLPR